MNPYGHSTTNCDSDDTRAQCNPAKPLLYVIGALGSLQGIIAIPVGLFVGPHILGAAVAMLGFGSTALWLAYRRYDRFGRLATITWGVLAIILLLVATILQPPSMFDVAGIVFILFMLLIVSVVLLVAVCKQADGFVS